MFFYLISVILFVSGANSADFVGFPQKKAAESEAQLRFALENKYDDTGPGAKRPEFAYDTYKTLEDALVGYLDDPDTKLPEYERSIGTQRLYLNQNKANLNNIDLKNVWASNIQDNNLLNGYKLLNSGFGNPLQQDKGNLGKWSLIEDWKKESLKVDRFQPIKGSPLNVAHYTRGTEVKTREFDPNPQYSFSYGVHDKKTGDSKSVQEKREGGVVTGFYTFVDADGHQRTVHYSADDKHGFQAVVNRGANAQ